MTVWIEKDAGALSLADLIQVVDEITKALRGRSLASIAPAASPRHRDLLAGAALHLDEARSLLVEALGLD